MQLASVLLLALCGIAAAVPSSFVKVNNGALQCTCRRMVLCMSLAVAAGWSKVTSKSSMQRLLSEAEWRALWEGQLLLLARLHNTGSFHLYIMIDGMRVVNVREEISDDEDEAEAALQWTRDHDDDDNDGSGDDDRPEREGECVG